MVLRFNRQRIRKLCYIASTLFLSSLGVGLILYALRSNMNWFLTPSEVLQESLVIPLPKKLYKTIKLGGYVLPASVDRRTDLKIQFQITDFKQQITVQYQGVLPDLFRENQGVIAIGRWDPKSKQLMAEKILAKHDERYRPAEYESESLR